MAAQSDIAQRVYDHTWKLDPIIRSLLDTDFYKLLMLQMIWGLHPDVEAKFSLLNRSRSVRLADEIDEGELRAQLDHARSLRFAKKEMIWLAGNSFYGRHQIFEPRFLAWLANFALPDYELRREDGQFVLHFHGRWCETTMWEIPALAIVNELRSRSALKRLGRFELDVLYARAKAKLWSKVERLRDLPGLKISDFGTRRRHSFLWQRWCVEALKEGLGGAFIGSSNVLLAMNNDLEAIGTNAHELPMVLAALARRRDGTASGALSGAGRLAEILRRQPADRAAGCLRHARLPAQRARLGRRLDRRPARFGAPDRGRRGDHRVVEGARPQPARQAARLLRRARRRHDRGHVPSFPGPRADELRLGHQPHQRLRGVRPKPQCGPQGHFAGLQGERSHGHPAVKLADNPRKATGDAAEIARYLRVFGDAGRVEQDVVV